MLSGCQTSVYGPRDRQQQHAFLDGLNIVRQAPIEREQAAQRKIEGATDRPDLDAPADRLDGDSAFGLMRGHTCVGAQGHQHDAEIVVLEKRLRVLPGRPCRLMMELLDFSCEIEFEVRSGQRLWVRAPMVASLSRSGLTSLTS